MTDPTRFYSTQEVPYGYFSNFSPHGFELDGAWWPTSEHYFQAQKFAGTEREELVCQAPAPIDAARLGRDRTFPVRSDWEQVNDADGKGLNRLGTTLMDVRRVLRQQTTAPFPART